MKSTILTLIAVLMTLPAMAKTVVFSGGVLVKEEVSTSQTNYQLNLKSGLKLKLVDIKQEMKSESLKKNIRQAAEGGWQPEKFSLSEDESSVILEAIRLFAFENCSAAHISQGLAENFSQHLNGMNIDISKLDQTAKTCLSK